MIVRDMTIEEVQKVIERKNEEIALLTKTLSEYMAANNYAYSLLSCFKGEY